MATVNAVTDWAEIKHKYTANIRSALVRDDGRPVFFSGALRDIDSANGSYVVSFDVDAWMIGAVSFRLVCDDKAIHMQLSDPTGRRFVGVARLTDVQVIRDAPNPILDFVQRQFRGFGQCVYVKPLE